MVRLGACWAWASRQAASGTADAAPVRTTSPSRSSRDIEMANSSRVLTCISGRRFGQLVESLASDPAQVLVVIDVAKLLEVPRQVTAGHPIPVAGEMLQVGGVSPDAAERVGAKGQLDDVVDQIRGDGHPHPLGL